MKKDFSPAFCSTLDSKNEHIITTINRNLGIITENTCKGDYYGNIPTSSQAILDYYLLIRAKLLRTDKAPNFVHIYDFGCGIGNVLELFGRLFQSDPMAESNLKALHLHGVERLSPYINVAKPLLEDITPFVSLASGNFATDCTLADHFNYFKAKVNEDIKRGNTTAIVVINRPLKDFDNEVTLEKYIIKTSPENTILFFPMGCIAMPKAGIRRVDKKLIYKTKLDVQY